MRDRLQRTIHIEKGMGHMNGKASWFGKVLFLSVLLLLLGLLSSCPSVTTTGETQIEYFKINGEEKDAVITSGESVELSWKVVNAAECKLVGVGSNGQKEPDLTSVVCEKTTSYKPTQTTRYTLNAYKTTGSQPIQKSWKVTDPLTFPLTFKKKLTANDGAESDFFGYFHSVAIDRDTAIVGAYGHDGKGSAYIFVRSGDTWTQQTELTASDGAADDQFGISVALSGDTAIVGAVGDDDAVKGIMDSGSAYIFERSSSGVWTQQPKLTADDRAAGDQFGIYVAISGDTAIVSAWKDDDAVKGMNNSGSAYIFVRSGGGWVPQTKLTASDGAAGDQFGTSVALSGDTAIVGAYGVASFSGAAYIFERNSSVWVPKAKLTAEGGKAGDEFGSFVALSGDTAIVGALKVAGSSGAAYIFERNSNGVWVLKAKLTAEGGAAGDYFGSSVAISGDTAIVGAFGDDGKGSAYIFVRSGDTWTPQTKLTANDGAADDQFGISAAISGDTAIVGAVGDDDKGMNSGSAYVFSR
jgi:FG-GAP repeat